MKYLLLILSLFISFNSKAQNSLFEIPGDDLIIEVSKEVKLCIVKFINPISDKLKEVNNCYELDSNLEDLISRAKSESKNKKEIIFAFGLRDKIISPMLKSPKAAWNIKSIIYKIKYDVYKLELIDKDGNYLY